MKKLMSILIVLSLFTALTSESCGGKNRPANTSALDEQAHTEKNQQKLSAVQPPPDITWSLERDNLIKRMRLQNDRSVSFFMYVFIEGIGQPIGYYQVTKVSSVNSQLTNTQQIISGMSRNNNLPPTAVVTLPSPAEDGSYGTNGDGVFGFTPEEIYIETNLKYIASTVPLHFNRVVSRLAIIDTEEAAKLLKTSKSAMKLN